MVWKINKRPKKKTLTMESNIQCTAFPSKIASTIIRTRKRGLLGGGGITSILLTERCAGWLLFEEIIMLFTCTYLMCSVLHLSYFLLDVVQELCSLVPILEADQYIHSPLARLVALVEIYQWKSPTHFSFQD